MNWIGMVAVALWAAVFLGCASVGRERPEPLRPAARVDLERYMGDWYVVANIPYWAERNCYGSIERYKLMEDGRIDTTFLANRGGFDGRSVEARSVAIVTDKETNAVWRIDFLGGLVRIPLVILEVSNDYRWAVVATPDRKLAWVFSRAPVLPEADFVRALAVLEANRIPAEKLVRVPQRGARPDAD